MQWHGLHLHRHIIGIACRIEFCIAHGLAGCQCQVEVAAHVRAVQCRFALHGHRREMHLLAHLGIEHTRLDEVDVVETAQNRQVTAKIIAVGDIIHPTLDFGIGISGQFGSHFLHIECLGSAVNSSRELQRVVAGYGSEIRFIYREHLLYIHHIYQRIGCKSDIAIVGRFEGSHSHLSICFYLRQQSANIKILYRHDGAVHIEHTMGCRNLQSASLGGTERL